MDPSLISQAIDSRLSDVRTCSLGAVVGYDPIGQTVDVRLLARRFVPSTEDGRTFEDVPILPAVPVIVPGTGRTYLQTDPLVPGDLVLVLFARESPAEAWLSGLPAEPGDLSTHGLSGGFALPVCRGAPTLPRVALGGSEASSLALAGPLATYLGGLVSALVSMAAAGNSGGPLTFVPPAVPTIGTTKVLGC